MPDPTLERLDQIIVEIRELVAALKALVTIEYHEMPEDEKCHCAHVEDIIHA